MAIGHKSIGANAPLSVSLETSEALQLSMYSSEGLCYLALTFAL